MMREVLYALAPGTLAMMWFFGWGILFNIVITISLAIAFEALMLKLRTRPIRPFLGDYSAVVTGWLLALTMPPFAPWWLLAIAVFFSIVIAKHLYGGLGYNPFNPAMIGYAVALISFPVDMVQWPAANLSSFSSIDFVSAFQHIMLGKPLANWDAVTMATSLDAIKTGLRMEQTVPVIEQGDMFGLFAGNGWEWVSLGYLLGGLWLLYRKIISWHIPVSLLGILALLSTVFWLIDNQQYASPLFHLLAGGAMLGAFFIATDPVSASTTPMGKILYAIGIGFLIYVIRVFGSGYPDGVAFAVIIMNMAVPIIDYYTRPRVFGANRSNE
ncbi:MAG: Electron transport complex protein RnfD [uncultured Thiotrichaceae bacterium]|uniref:Ion-translocating oxidoreductase complex subunit D n=1 Tax=uncultured Thiotrichaceae bacterium TaxID=298394 RepID=A0A6S6TSL2_9GAMM|nr:MAG: Electron transport complex protein RnfD [uncultured Thiotrichaceae bacterium]